MSADFMEPSHLPALAYLPIPALLGEKEPSTFPEPCILMAPLL